MPANIASWVVLPVCFVIGSSFLVLWPRGVEPWKGSAEWKPGRPREGRKSGLLLVGLVLFVAVAQFALHVLSHKSLYIETGFDQLMIPSSAALFPLTLAALLYLYLTRNSVLFGRVLAVLVGANILVAVGTIVLHFGVASLYPRLFPTEMESLWSATAAAEILLGTCCFVGVSVLMIFISRASRWSRVSLPLTLALVTDSFVYPLTLWLVRDEVVYKQYWPHVLGHLVFEIPVGLAYGLGVWSAYRSHQTIGPEGGASPSPLRPFSPADFLGKAYFEALASVRWAINLSQIESRSEIVLTKTTFVDTDLQVAEFRPQIRQVSIRYQDGGGADDEIVMRRHILDDMPKEGPSHHTLLIDLPLPHEFTEEVAVLRGRQAFRSRREEREFEEGVRLRILYGGEDVACLSTPKGLIVVAHTVPGEQSLWSELDKLSKADRARVRVIVPDPWDSGTEAVVDISDNCICGRITTDIIIRRVPNTPQSILHLLAVDD